MPEMTQPDRDKTMRAILASPLLGASALSPEAALMLDRLLQLVRIISEEDPRRGNSLSFIFRDRLRFVFYEYPGKGWVYDGFEGGDFSTW